MKTIFQSKAWARAWSDVWGQGLPEGDFYTSTFFLKGFLPTVLSAPKGVATQSLRCIRYEYWGEGLAQEDLLWQLENLDSAYWMHAVFSDVVCGGNAEQVLSKYALQHSLSFVKRNASRAYYVDVANGSFTDYCMGLSSSARLRLLNRRKRLRSLGEVKFMNLWPDVDGFVEHLNRFHRKRWGKDCYRGKGRQFVNLLLPLLEKEGALINLNVMTLEGEVISSVLDVEFNSVIYNLQSGFKEGVAKGLSTATLHLGYQIEEAFSRPSVIRYDLMAGKGKYSDFKAYIATDYLDLNDVFLVRTPLLKWLYHYLT